MTSAALSLADITAAAARLRGHAVRTPLLRHDLIDERCGCRVLIKAEPLQRTGSFKFRGAFNAVSQAGDRPVVAYSSGNHAQGVAAAAQLLGVRSTIVMPSDAPAIKIANTRRYGADVRLYDRANSDREAIAAAIAESEDAALIKPYDAPATIAGQGTVGLEMAEQCAELGVVPDAAVVCCGGGGLIAGTALALRAHHPTIRVHAAEPVGFDDTRRSLAAGRRLANEPGGRSSCDALLATEPGELTFAINRHLLAGGFAVDDDDVADAMLAAMQCLKLVVEPGGAVALASGLAGQWSTMTRSGDDELVVLVVLSGGNVDAPYYAELLAAARRST
ncbi:MAG: threonine/serine dehydratase [Pseudomonadota bacterium]